jgi:hypothetical protein
MVHVGRESLAFVKDKSFRKAIAVHVNCDISNDAYAS